MSARASSRLAFTRFVPLGLDLLTAAHARELDYFEVGVLCVLHLIAKDEGDSGIVHTSARALASRWDGLTEGTAQRVLQRLEEKGWIRRFRRRGDCGTYPVTIQGYILQNGKVQRRVDAAATTDWRTPVTLLCDTNKKNDDRADDADLEAADEAARQADGHATDDVTQDAGRGVGRQASHRAADDGTPIVVEKGNREGEAETLAPGGADRVTPEWLANLWAETNPGLSQVRRNPLAKGIRQKLAAAAKRDPDTATWRERFARVAASDLLSGRAEDWRASLIWATGPENTTKIDAGNYENHKASAPRGPLALDRFGQQEMLFGEEQTQGAPEGPTLAEARAAEEESFRRQQAERAARSAKEKAAHG